MLIVAIGWMYVVTLMAATAPSVLEGIMTFFGYGVLPLSIVHYLAGGRRRAARRAAARKAGQPEEASATSARSDSPGAQ